MCLMAMAVEAGVQVLIFEIRPLTIFWFRTAVPFACCRPGKQKRYNIDLIFYQVNGEGSERCKACPGGNRFDTFK